MTKVFNKVNSSLRKTGKKYTSDMKKRSTILKKARKKRQQERDEQIIKCAGIIEGTKDVTEASLFLIRSVFWMGVGYKIIKAFFTI